MGKIEFVKLKPDEEASCYICGRKKDLFEIKFWRRRNQNYDVTLCDKCLKQLKAEIDYILKEN